MTDANNSNNSQGGTVVITGSGGGGGGGGTVVSGSGTFGNWISVVPSKQYTITIPSGSGTCSTGNVIVTGGNDPCPQLSFDDIELAVPVEEKKKKSDGCSCRKCKEYYQYAEPNQDDGTLICYGCRMVW
jgi:hypothetical protein